MSGGGSKQPSNTTQTTTTIPKWAEPYGMQMLGQASALTNINNNPYQSYGGQRVADFGSLQNQSFQGAADMQTAPQLGAASNLAGLASLGGLGMAGSYTPAAGGNAYTSQDYNGGAATFDNEAAQQYMNPYMQSVVGIQQREAQRAADTAKNVRGAQAATSGTWGGNRQALGDFNANRDLSFQMGDIQAKGLQDAYSQAQGQFNADQQRIQQDKLAGNQFNLTNAGNLAQYGLAGQQLGEQSRQFGSNLGIQGLNLAMQGANTMGNLGQEQYQQQQGILGLQNQFGAQQQAQDQQGLTNQYNEFINQQNYPYQQLGFLSDMIHGLPTQQSSTIYQSTNPAAQVAGLAGGLGSLYMASQQGKT